MAFWVTDQSGTTFVSYASSESRARAEAKKRGLNVDEITPVSAGTSPEQLEKYERLTASTLYKFQVLCLTAGQISSMLACLVIVGQTIIMMAPIRGTLEFSLVSMLGMGLLFGTFAGLVTVFSYVKQQLKP